MFLLIVNKRPGLDDALAYPVIVPLLAFHLPEPALDLPFPEHALPLHLVRGLLDRLHGQLLIELPLLPRVLAVRVPRILRGQLSLQRCQTLVGLCEVFVQKRQPNLILLDELVLQADFFGVC